MFKVAKYFDFQLDEHFSRYMKEFVSLCLKKVPAEASVYALPTLTTISFSFLLCMFDQCLCIWGG